MKNILLFMLCFVAHTGFSQNGKALFDEGEVLYKENKYNEALSKFAEAEKSNYKEAALYAIRGNCYIKLNNKEEALKCYDKALTIDPKNKRALFNRGVINSGDEKYDLAISDFSTLIAVNNDKDALKNRGGIYLILRKNQEAINDFEAYIKQDQANDFVYKMLGIAYSRLSSKKQDLQKSVEALTKAIAINATDASYYYYRGYSYYDMENNTKAMADFDKALELNPEYAEAWFEKGNLHYDKKDTDKQIECYTKAIAFNADNHRYYYWRGKAYLEKKQDKEKACADFTKARELGSKDAEAYKSLCESKGRLYIVTD